MHFQQAGLGAERRQAEAGCVGAKIFLRVRLEDEDAKRAAECPRMPDQRLVAAMDAVEIADGDGRAARRIGQVLVVTEDLHSRALATCRAQVP